MKKKQGFASLSLEKRREIARLGGRSTQAKGKAYKFTSEKAREAGRKGGTSAAKTRYDLKVVKAWGIISRVDLRHWGSQLPLFWDKDVATSELGGKNQMIIPVKVTYKIPKE